MTLNEFLVRSCEDAIKLQNSENGSMPAGHNGPYIYPETPVRNTAHWCQSFLKSHEITGKSEFYDAALRCGSYLMSKEAIPMGSVYFCRMNPNKDFANGLVGQTWVIESLVKLFNYTKDESYIDKAVDIFKKHPFDNFYKAWIRRNVDGSYNGFDKTFNHELWFGAAASLLSTRDKEIESEALAFMNHMDVHLEIYSDGCIKHKGYFLDTRKPEKIKRFLKLMATPKSDKNYLKMKSIGYHSFNTYAFSIIHSIFPDLAFWKSRKFNKVIDYLLKQEFYDAIDGNKYGMPYNVTGFEVAYSLETFKPNLEGLDNICEKWINRQINFGKKSGSFLLTENSKDPNTAMARLYETTRLKGDYKLNL